jgi:hypothetical protein
MKVKKQVLEKFDSQIHYEIGLLMKMSAFSDIALCSLIEVDRRFRGAYCLHNVLSLLHETTRRHIQEGCLLHTAAV